MGKSKNHLKGRTIEQLEGKIWGEPEYPSHLVITCHRLRKKPIDQFTVEDLRIMIGQDIGAEYLVPSAMEILEIDPFAQGDYYPGDLLKAVVTLPKQYWREHPVQQRQLLNLSSQALNPLKEPQTQKRPTDKELIRAIERFQDDLAI